MKANEIVSKLIAIKESKDFKWMDDKDIITIESEGSEYKLPVSEIDNFIKKLSKINEAKPYKPTGGNGIMKTYIFTDSITKETFEVSCEPYEVHNIELKNEDLYKWMQGRILTRDEK